MKSDIEKQAGDEIMLEIEQKMSSEVQSLQDYSWLRLFFFSNYRPIWA